MAASPEPSQHAPSLIRVWDDEDSNHFAEGHHEPDAFLAAVEAYIDECGVREDNARWGITYRVEDVEQVWCVESPDDEERMHLADADAPGAFAVTLVRHARDENRSGS